MIQKQNKLKATHSGQLHPVCGQDSNKIKYLTNNYLLIKLPMPGVT